MMKVIHQCAPSIFLPFYCLSLFHSLSALSLTLTHTHTHTLSLSHTHTHTLSLSISLSHFFFFGWMRITHINTQTHTHNTPHITHIPETADPWAASDTALQAHTQRASSAWLPPAHRRHCCQGLHTPARADVRKEDTSRKQRGTRSDQQVPSAGPRKRRIR